MRTEEILKVLVGIIFGLTYLLFFFKVFLKTERKKRLKKYFFRGLISVLANEDDTKKTVEKFELINKKLIEKFPKETVRYRNSLEILEDIYTQLNVDDLENYKKRYKLSDEDIKILNKENIIKMIEFLKKERPFSTLNSKEAHLLMNINNALENNNEELGKTMLSQLSDNIELLESNLYNQEKSTKKSFIVAVIGVILTIIFGLSQLIPFISELINKTMHNNV